MEDVVDFTTSKFPHTQADDIADEVDIFNSLTAELSRIFADPESCANALSTFNEIRIGSGTEIADVETMIKTFRDAGVKVDYELMAEVSEDAVMEEEKFVTTDEQQIKMNIPRVPVAEYVFDEVMKPLLKCVIEDPFELDCPDWLVQLWLKWQKYDFQYVPNKLDTIEARSNTKKPALSCLNLAVATLKRKLGGKTLKVLLFGCGRGTADLKRLIKAYGGYRGLSVYTYDPYVARDPRFREMEDGYIIPGTDYAVEEKLEFGVDTFHLVIAMNSLHYLGYVIEGDYKPLKKLLHAVKDEGIVVGMYPYFHGVATCKSVGDLDRLHGGRAHVDLLALEVGRDGKVVMKTRVFDTPYDEPVLDPSVFQEVAENSGFRVKIMKGIDVRNQIEAPSTAKYINIEKYPEVNAFASYILTKDSDFRPRDFHSMEKTFNIAEAITVEDEDNRPQTCINTGRPLAGILCHEFIEGGPWLASIKTNGIAANVRVKNDKMYVHTSKYPVMCFPTGNFGKIDLTFQAELVEYGGGKFDIIFIQLNYYDGKPISFGPGLRLGMQLADSALMGIKFKEWTYDLKGLVDRITSEHLEGIVLMEYLASPPKQLKAKDQPLVRKVGNAIYVKEAGWTVDVMCSPQGIGEIKINGKIAQYRTGIDKVPPGGRSFVAEFEMKSRHFIRIRDDRTHENSQKVIDGLAKALEWKDFLKLVDRNIIKWRPMRNHMLFLAEPSNTWRMEKMLALAVSYPRGYIFIEDKKARTQVYQLRKAIYGTINLNSMLLSYTENMEADNSVNLDDVKELTKGEYDEMQYATYIEQQEVVKKVEKKHRRRNNKMAT